MGTCGSTSSKLARIEALSGTHFTHRQFTSSNHNITTTSSKEWLFPNKFSVGYRHMVRFFTVGIWEVASGLGYQFVMRLDDDAFVLSN